MSDKKLKIILRPVLHMLILFVSFIGGVQLAKLVLQLQIQNVSVDDLFQVTPVAVISTYEHCILAKNDVDPVNQYKAGTPIPFEPVLFGIGKKEIRKIDINLVQVGIFDNNNFHVVIVPVDYSENEIGQVELFSRKLLNIFEGVNIDLSYVEQSIPIGIEHINRHAEFMDLEEINALMESIRDIQEADAIIFGVNTDSYLGTSYGTYSIVSTSDPAVFRILTHELAHSLGLGDGYPRFYPEGEIPSTELFYIDYISRDMETALDQLETLPPLYEVGTCNGRKIYTFYESSNNIMGDYYPTGPNSWGEGVFTPLQIIIMNNYIEKIKSK